MGLIFYRGRLQLRLRYVASLQKQTLWSPLLANDELSISCVGTGVPDCPFGCKCYFMTTRVAEDVDSYECILISAVGEGLAPPEFHKNLLYVNAGAPRRSPTIHISYNHIYPQGRFAFRTASFYKKAVKNSK